MFTVTMLAQGLVSKQGLESEKRVLGASLWVAWP